MFIQLFISSNSDISLYTKIRGLQEGNAKLVAERSELERTAREESEARQQLAETLRLSKMNLQAAYREIEGLKRVKNTLPARAKKFTRRQAILEKGMSAALSALQRYKYTKKNPNWNKWPNSFVISNFSGFQESQFLQNRKGDSSLSKAHSRCLAEASKERPSQWSHVSSTHQL